MSEPSSPAFTPPEPAPPRLGAASRAAAGPKAVAKTAELLGATGIVRGAGLLLRVNQADGFDCQSCAWPSPDSGRHAFEFCENGAKAVADEATRKSSPEKRAAWMAAVGLGAQYGILLPFSRGHESESDHLGLLFMARAGYDPAAAPAFWTRFGQAGGAKPPEFLSTHPSDATRVRQLQAWLPEARAQMPRKP